MISLQIIDNSLDFTEELTCLRSKLLNRLYNHIKNNEKMTKILKNTK